MNLEKTNQKKSEIINSSENQDNPNLRKRSSFSQTPQPSLKDVSNDRVKIIEEELNQIAGANKLTKESPLFFGVKIYQKKTRKNNNKNFFFNFFKFNKKFIFELLIIYN